MPAWLRVIGWRVCSLDQRVWFPFTFGQKPALTKCYKDKWNSVIYSQHECKKCKPIIYLDIIDAHNWSVMCVNNGHTCTSYIVKSKSGSMKKSNYTNVIKMCLCVWNRIMVWLIPCHGSSLLLYFTWTWAIYFFLHALWACGIPSLGMNLFYFWHAFWACGIPSLGTHLFFFYSPYHL